METYDSGGQKSETRETVSSPGDDPVQRRHEECCYAEQRDYDPESSCECRISSDCRCRPDGLAFRKGD